MTKDLGDGIQLLLGVKKEDGEEKTSTQSYHFDKNAWTPKAVKKWLKEHNEIPIELEMAKKSEVKEDASGSNTVSNPIMGISDNTGGEEIKSNSNIVTHKGDVIPEQIPIDRVPEKLFGNVRQQDLPELLESEIRPDDEILVEKLEPEGISEDYDESVINEPDVELESQTIRPNFSLDRARQKLVDWSKNEDGSVNKRPLLKWFLDVDGGSAQSVENYRYPTGYVVDGSPQYCKLSLDASWDLAAGKQTGVANRNIQKKIIFIKNREGIPLTEDQMDFTERHMSADKVNYHILEDDNSPGGIEFVDQTELKLNSSPAGSKIIYEDDTVIDVPVVPMREGVFTGTDGIPTLKKYEYFGKDAHWLEGQPILKGHTAPTELVTYKHNRIGKLMNVTARPDKRDVVAVARYYKDKLTPEDLTRIKSGTPYDGSIAYTTHTSMTSGDLNGTKYNAVEDGGYHFYHFAELANGIGACSTKDGCGFMLNEQEIKNNSVPEILEPKVFYNDKRRAEVTQEESVWTVKLNSAVGGSGLLEASTEQDAIEWSRTYVKSGLIPISMKLNYRCSREEQNGTGKGSCSGSTSQEKSSSKKTDYEDYSKIPDQVRVKLLDTHTKQIKIFEDDIASLNATKKEVSGTKTGEKMIPFLDKDIAGLTKDLEESKRILSELQKKNKQNSQFSKFIGNNMTEEFIKADDTEESGVDIVKMNEAFEQKLNERDAKITELTAQVDELVQKQNAAEQALVDKKAAEDFEAFKLKLNAKARDDATTHYEGFKADGWSYFNANPGILRQDIPKMNARGQPAAEGDNASALQTARDMLRKSQKESFGKRSH